MIVCELCGIRHEDMRAICPTVIAELERLHVSEDVVGRLEAVRHCLVSADDVGIEQVREQLERINISRVQRDIQAQLVAAFASMRRTSANARAYAQALHALTLRGIRYTRVIERVDDGACSFTVRFLEQDDAKGTLRLSRDIYACRVADDHCLLDVGTAQPPQRVDVRQVAVWRYDGPTATDDDQRL